MISPQHSVSGSSYFQISMGLRITLGIGLKISSGDHQKFWFSDFRVGPRNGIFNKNPILVNFDAGKILTLH